MQHNHADHMVPGHAHLWPKETAGSRMTGRVPTVFEHQDIGEVQSLLVECIDAFQSVDDVYVLGKDNSFVGVMSIKEVYAADKKEKAGKACKRESLISVHPGASQERVVYIALKNNIKAVPVVDEHNTFLGVVPNHTILSILYKEAHEDLLHMAGITHPHAVHSNVIDTPLLISYWHRAPWLFLGLLGGLFSATVIGLFEETLQQNLLLATFIPLIVYMSSAVGMQMETCLIRDLALDHRLRFARYLQRQLLITGLIALTVSAAMYAAMFLLHGDTKLGLVMGVSMAAAVMSSVMTGLLMPYLFSRLRLDPADASGPVATILQDLLSVVIYFSVATWLL